MSNLHDQLQMKEGFILPRYQQRLNELINKIYQDDKVLAEAAKHYASKRYKTELSNEAIQLLEEWKHLKDKAPSKCEGQNKLSFFNGQLAQLIEPRAIPFLVFEQLSTWDPQGRLQNWTKNYKTHINDVPDIEGYSPIALTDKLKQRYFGEYRKELDFVRYVAAACAEYCGLWCERNALQDISFIASEYELAKQIIKECKEPKIKKQSKDSLDKILSILNSYHQDKTLSVEWKWRHVASMRNKLGDIKPCHIKANLWRIGFINVCCTSVESCYQLLGYLHTYQSVKSLNEYFMDFIGNPPPSGYKAIHTVVEITEGKARNKIHVRFIVKEKGAQDTWELALDKHMKQRRIPDKKSIRVFTPEGGFRDLPIGSTVLDFASHLHESFIGRTDFAIINDTQELSLLDKLTEGDNINLQVNNTYELLPEGWEKHVATKTKYIRRKLKNNMSSQFQKKAHERLSKIIPEYAGMTPDVRKLVLQAVVSEANNKIFNHQPTPHKHHSYEVKHWLTELGIKEEIENQTQVNYPFSSVIDSYKEKIFINSLKGWVNSATDFPEEAIISKEMRKDKLSISICNLCSPTHHSKRVIKVDGNNLIFHRESSSCGAGGVPVETKLRATIGQYFLIEISRGINNQKRILSQILNIFTNMNIKITEVVGKDLAVDWGVIRIEVRLVSGDEISSIKKSITSLDNIERVLSPNDHKAPILENLLPPRNDLAISDIMHPQPYTCGGVVKQNSDFYNRNEELGCLLNAFEYQVKTTFAGSKVFISGPLKTGKTSLAYMFQRTLKKPDQGVLPLIVYYQAQTRDRWSDVENKLSKGLIHQIQEQYPAALNVLRKANVNNHSLESLLSFSGKKHDGKRIINILIVDEVLIPFRQAHHAEMAGDSSELDNIKQFAGIIHNHPGTLLVWIGPKAPVNSLHVDLKNTLRAGEQIELKPFSKLHTKDLLRVNNLRWKYRITINKHIIDHLWKITNGNPFWLNHLGRKMWVQASQKESTGGTVEYTAADVSDAKDDLLLNDSLFADRIFPEGYSNTQLNEYVRCILEILFKHKNKKQKRWLKTWASADEVIDAFEQKSLGKPATNQDVKSVFNDLVAMGGFDRKNNSIRIAAPLLADWIERSEIIDLGKGNLS